MPNSNDILLVEQDLKIFLKNPKQIEWGKVPALRFDLCIKSPGTNRTLITIPGFVIRNQSFQVPQTKTKFGYFPLVNLHQSFLTLLQNTAIDSWEALYPEVNFPEKEISEE